MVFEFNHNDIQQHLALIYMWEIFDRKNNLKGVYVGKAKSGSKRPLKHYKRNVNRLINDKPYRKSKPDGYRKVHKALAKAVKNNEIIKLTLLCNISSFENINDIEQNHIKEKTPIGSQSWRLNG